MSAQRKGGRRTPAEAWLPLAAGLSAVVLAALALATLVVTSGANAQLGAAGVAAAPTRRLIVTVHTRDDRGRVFCALWRGPEGYPTEREHAVGQALDRTVRRHRATCVFEDVEPGEHAIALFHDENGNNDLDTNLLGIPTEGTGASNGEHNFFGPPRYEYARFTIPPDPEHRLSIRVYY